MSLNYTDAQTQAVYAPEENLQLIAGAGSGKTQVMAARVAELLGREANTPKSIIAFTFTERAAAELKERIYHLVAEEHGEVVGLAEMYVGTMHGFCLNLLQNHLFKFLKYSVLSDVQTRLLIDRNSRKSGLSTVTVASGPSAGVSLRRGVDSRLYQQLMNLLREDEVDWDLIPDAVIDALGAYRELLHEHRYLDYSEILLEAVMALEGNAPEELVVQQRLAADVRHVIVDEYQDVNPLQERLVSAMYRLGARISVVGDDDQTIYQWRGSDIDGILTFADRYPDVTQIPLSDNFRSTSGIVSTGQSVAERNEPHRLTKSMVASGHQVFERGDILALTFADEDEEADWIARRARELVGVSFNDTPGGQPRGLAYSDIAILLRSVAGSAAPIVAALRRHGVPFVVKGLNNLFEAPEIRASALLFEYMVRAAAEDDVRSAWLDASLGLRDADLDPGIAVLDEASRFDAGNRWGSYNIQRTFLDFLEAVGLREERVEGDPGRGEIAFYNLGKFSQLISDFEQIHFRSAPASKYETFVRWLQRDAPSFYEEGGVDEGYATPDAVQILTVHRAKGLQWPAVFVPAMQRNRFPSKRQGGRNVWHVIPRASVERPERYDGSIADETRLFYVAVTRAQKYLAVSFAPGNSNLYRRPSDLFTAMTGYTPVLTRPARLSGKRLPSQPLASVADVTLSFSELKYFFECPYQFKLRFLYGFNPPLHEALGYGKSVHDCMAEIHKRAMDGDVVTTAEAESLVDTHLHTPFAYPQLKDQLRAAAVAAVRRYVDANAANIERTEYAEKEIELVLGDGITVNGRVDLIRRLDTEELSIVDFKSTERAQEEDVTRQQLHVYAMGYERLTGHNADLIEVLNLDERGASTRELVDGELLAGTADRITQAGHALRDNELPRLPTWCNTCATCDLRGVCREPRT